MVEVVEIGLMILQALWFIAPAYAANAFPPLLRGKKPIDSGAKWGKYRILGDGKTIEGTAGGVAFGIFFGLIQIYFQPLLAPFGLGLFEMTLPVIILLSIGALLGDMINSFFKRRLGIERGGKVSVINRLDFVIGALVLVYPVAGFNLQNTIIIIIITPIIHKLANILAFALNIKKVPY